MSTIDSFVERLKRRKDIRDVVYHRVLEPAPAEFSELKDGLNPLLEDALKRQGIERLYTHQCEAIERIRDGRNVVVMTPTASGKTLVYNIPVIESILEDSSTHALYIFPLKGLEQDQLSLLEEFQSLLSVEDLCAIYDGDTSSYRRKKIRLKPPNIVLTNPDMLHLAILPFHDRWEGFFRGLRYVVIDEIHTYRGVLGSHMAQIIRRLQRICNLYGSSPLFIHLSATIANPVELSEMLTGLPFNLVCKSGAPQGKRHFLFIDPAMDTSPYTLTVRILSEALKEDFRTIVFTKARKVTELIYRWLKESAPHLADRVSAYRAGFLPEERRLIEQALFDGTLEGVITTSALELGVDIGGLDVCVLTGYPGTISATWQRSGRAGRSGRTSLTVLIALEDALDKYFMRHPEEFF
ncbi:MAG TPA: DEAD/DEAH box helicase, partial [Deltaproteobacteria bacterium]|nr:DEAD/DEAH box helicase [Deltaproteobacteria bacterium]